MIHFLAQPTSLSQPCSASAFFLMAPSVVAGVIASGSILRWRIAGLPDACAGAQLVTYDPSTVVSPPGRYSGVTLSYVLTPGQVTTPGIVVHLPRVDNAETVLVAQNASADQTFTFQSIPNLKITVYAGTALTLADGTRPNPFPLSVVEIPYDRLPEKMQPDPTQDPVFAMSIEPFNSSSSRPLAVSFPNRVCGTGRAARARDAPWPRPRHRRRDPCRASAH